MTQTAEKTDLELAEEWHNQQIIAKANGNKIFRVIVHQRQHNKIYQASFIEDGFRNKSEVKDFYMGDSNNGKQRRHFGNEELFKRISYFGSELVKFNDYLHFEYEMVMPMRLVDTTVYPTESSRKYGSPDYIYPKNKTYEEVVHPDWTLIGTTNKHLSKTNNIKLISITEIK